MPGGLFVYWEFNTCEPLASPYSPDLRGRSLNVWVSEVGAAKLAATIKIQDSPDFDTKTLAGNYVHL